MGIGAVGKGRGSPETGGTRSDRDVWFWLSSIWFFTTLWTVAHEAPPSMGFSWQEYCSGLSFYFPGDLPALQADLTEEAQNWRLTSINTLVLWAWDQQGEHKVINSFGLRMWLWSLEFQENKMWTLTNSLSKLAHTCWKSPTLSSFTHLQNLFHGKCKNPKANYQKSPKQTKNLDKEKSNNIQFLIVL